VFDEEVVKAGCLMIFSADAIRSVQGRIQMCS
jgi:hypothetical protein